MTLLLIFTIIMYALIGTAIGRKLYVHRLGNAARYYIADPNQYFDDHQEIYSTHDAASAQTYGLWSIPLWPLTLAVYLIQLPTPSERQRKAQIKTAEEQKALEASLNNVYRFPLVDKL